MRKRMKWEGKTQRKGLKNEKKVSIPFEMYYEIELESILKGIS